MIRSKCENHCSTSCSCQIKEHHGGSSSFLMVLIHKVWTFYTSTPSLISDATRSGPELWDCSQLRQLLFLLTTNLKHFCQLGSKAVNGITFMSQSTGKIPLCMNTGNIPVPVIASKFPWLASFPWVLVQPTKDTQESESGRS